MRNSQKIEILHQKIHDVEEILHQKIHDVEDELKIAIKNGKILEQTLNKLAEVSGHKIVIEKVVKETICGDKIEKVVKLEKIVKK